jgi:hypothetical protein
MKSKEMVSNYPKLKESDSTVASGNLIPQFKGKIISGEIIENPVHLKPVNNKQTAGNNSSAKAKRLKGLCGNCDNAETCIYDKPATGIWHCNEYQ